MKKINTAAVVLKSLNYRDSDKIYTLFSKDFGKISVIARGVRKISSRRGGSMDTLNLVKVGLSETKGGIRQLDEVLVLNSFGKLKDVYNLSTKCSYIAELVHKTTEEGENARDLFELLVKFLKIAQKFPENIDLALRYFEIHYLELMGYGFDNEVCSKCKNPLNLSEGEFYLDVAHGSFVCNACGSYGPVFSHRAVKTLRDLKANKLTKTDSEVLKELENITFALIDNHLDIKIKSRELI